MSMFKLLELALHLYSLLTELAEIIGCYWHWLL
jgi:hypothetical protein